MISSGPALCPLAGRPANVEGTVACKDVRVVTADLSDVAIPNDVTVAYMYNPFPSVVLEKLLDRLVASAEQHPRRIRLLYAAFVQHELVVAHGFERARHTDKWAVYTFTP